MTSRSQQVVGAGVDCRLQGLLGIAEKNLRLFPIPVKSSHSLNHQLLTLIESGPTPCFSIRIGVSHFRQNFGVTTRSSLDQLKRRITTFRELFGGQEGPSDPCDNGHRNHSRDGLGMWLNRLIDLSQPNREFVVFQLVTPFAAHVPSITSRVMDQ